jgi:hypothetical protein
MLRAALLAVVFVAACNDREPPPVIAADPPSAIPAEPPAPSENSGVIKTSSEIGHLHGETLVDKSDKLPPAIHGHGEALRGAWVAPDGTEFLAGYMYTGVDGPDTGVVYRKDPGGTWKIAYSKRENELGHVWGTSSNDVWTAGVKTVAHWDGKAWSEVAIPMQEGSIGAIWGNGRELYVAGGLSGGEGRIYRRDAAGTWTLDGRAKHYLFGIGGADKTVVAVGNAGTIVRRVDGKWRDESFGDAQETTVSAVDDHDIYLAGGELLHSTGDGKWRAVPYGSKAQPTAVWARAANDVYAGTLAGLFHWDGTTWNPTAWKHDCETVAGNADTALVANQHM